MFPSGKDGNAKLMNYRMATADDSHVLAELNRQLILDEGHRNRMSVPELEQRMKGWLSGEYRAVVFEEQGTLVAYALFREGSDEIYLRQFFVLPERRRQGVGRRAIQLMRDDLWPRAKRLTVDVLIANTAAAAFWRAVGFSDYSLTLEIVPAEASPD